VSDIALTLGRLYVFPIKSCAGVEPASATLTATGLDLDRAWMLVDERDEFVTQREWPRLALVQPTLRSDDLVLRAPGMLALHVSLDAVEAPRRVRIWNDEVAAFDMGDVAAQWFSDFAGHRLRLVRFDPDQRRLSNRRWTGAVEAENAFSDGFPVLVVSSASLDSLNSRLRLQGAAPVDLRRFRPNLVLDGLDAHGEDWLDEITFDTPDGRVRLRLVKPCTRCPVPNVDPSSGERGDQPGLVLASYRRDPRMDGAVTFGMNAVIVEGVGCTLRVGQTGSATLRF